MSRHTSIPCLICFPLPPAPPPQLPSLYEKKCHCYLMLCRCCRSVRKRRREEPVIQDQLRNKELVADTLNKAEWVWTWFFSDFFSMLLLTKVRVTFRATALQVVLHLLCPYTLKALNSKSGLRPPIIHRQLPTVERSEHVQNDQYHVSFSIEWVWVLRYTGS